MVGCTEKEGERNYLRLFCGAAQILHGGDGCGGFTAISKVNLTRRGKWFAPNNCPSLPDPLLRSALTFTVASVTNLSRFSHSPCSRHRG